MFLDKPNMEEAATYYSRNSSLATLKRFFSLQEEKQRRSDVAVLIDDSQQEDKVTCEWSPTCPGLRLVPKAHFVLCAPFLQVYVSWMSDVLGTTAQTRLTYKQRQSQKRSGDLRLPVGVGDQRQAAIVPRNLPKNRKDKEQHLKKKEEDFLLEF